MEPPVEDEWTRPFTDLEVSQKGSAAATAAAAWALCSCSSIFFSSSNFFVVLACVKSMPLLRVLFFCLSVLNVLKHRSYLKNVNLGTPLNRLTVFLIDDKDVINLCVWRS